MLKRKNEAQIEKDLDRKIVFISGPRQSGKTTLAKLLRPNSDYLSYDVAENLKIFRNKSWDRSKDLIIFDELHKMKNWKLWLKGIYDTEGIAPKLIVTGSAKLDTFRKVGDSMAGRFLSHRLYPLDIKEILFNFPDQSPNEILDQLLITSGFPEPYLLGAEGEYKRWRRSHLDTILKQDLVDLTGVRSISQIENLITLLRERVGSPLSLSSLAQDLNVHHATIKQWLQILEELYVIFKVIPYHKNIARALQREAKYYFYDVAAVEGDVGAKLENLVAFSLLKELHRLEDSEGKTAALYYLRTKDGKEVDFMVQLDKKIYLIEVKTSETSFDKALFHFAKFFDGVEILQLVKNAERTFTNADGARVVPMGEWLGVMF